MKKFFSDPLLHIILIGQLLFVALALALARSFRTLEIRWPRWALAVPGYTVGSFGAYWTIQRSVMLLQGL